ncbi:MAG: TraR/DksA family transcriptional regulator [Candidatus Omnitrophota bacterium]
MDQKQLENFKKLLLKKREELISGMDHLTKDTLNKSQKDASGDLSGYSFHMADQASDNYDREFSLNLATDTQKVLYSIDEALSRIKDKSYGHCLKCNNKITAKRLNAVPYATYCIDCQKTEEEEEKRNKMSP